MAITKDQSNLQDHIRRDIAAGRLDPKIVEQLKAAGFEIKPAGRKKAPLAESAPEIAAQWHPTMNGDLTPADISWSSKKSVWWLCPECGNQYEMPVHNRTALHTDCQRCKRLKAAQGKSLALKKPWLAPLWDFIKNGELKLDEISFDTERELFWHCPDCGWEWKARPSKLKDAAHTCPACSGGDGYISSDDDPEAFYSHSNVLRAPVVIYPLLDSVAHFEWWDEGDLGAFDLVDTVAVKSPYMHIYSFRDFVELSCVLKGRAWMGLEELAELESQWVDAGGQVPERMNDKQACELARSYYELCYLSFGIHEGLMENPIYVAKLDDELRNSYPGDLERGMMLLTSNDYVNAKGAFWDTLDMEHPWANGRLAAFMRGEIAFTQRDYYHLKNNVCYKASEDEGGSLVECDGDAWFFVDWIEHPDKYKELAFKDANEADASTLFKNRAVVCLETGKVFESMMDAANAVDVEEGRISNSCKTTYRAGGFHWAYADEFNLAEKAHLLCGGKRKLNSNYRAVVMLETGIRYKSIAEAGREVGTDPARIRYAAMRGIEAAGRHWAYADDPDLGKKMSRWMRGGED